jgi:hypothetical protein
MARILPPPFGKKVGVQKCVRVLQTGQMYLRATVQDMYAVYKMCVISQNSRRKASAEDERSNALYA